MEPHRLNLIEGIRAIERGEITSEQWTHALLARIAQLDPRVEAFAWLDPAAAIAHAIAADRAAAGRLRGAPIGIKDIIDTRAIPTRMGSPAYDDHVPARSATVVERLENAGAFVLGKTVTTELAFYAPGKTRNPWNPAHTPGGSSSGSAAAVAAGFVPAALGTQTNGSVIRPAAYCGCVGFKPSFGRVP
ncbi:MAG TPA: amidase, partial [Burkholderiales bacterium]|nr:amidase [Burkholderiales bacterium]